MAAASPTPGDSFDAGPWFWGAATDVAAFGGSAAVSLALVALNHAFGLGGQSTPEWAWVVLVLGLDVAHVWATLFRTYFDGAELKQRPVRYLALPLLTYLGGVGLYLKGSLAFWAVLAYLAVFHFVRQQVGWVALYRTRAGDRRLLSKLTDDAAVYAATLYPLVHWHASLASRRFSWFMPGDFADVSRWAATLEPFVHLFWIAALAVFAVRHVAEAVARRRFQTGKSLVVATTAVLWFVGIVGTNSDFDFTVSNVIAHGVPYFVLLWHYGAARRREAPGLVGSRLVAAGPAVFLGVLVALAYVEELGWDRLVWHERPWLFGGNDVELGSIGLALVVPLLALPQAVHYLVDGLVWRRRETGPAQRAALGFSPLAASPATAE
jgi:hypothetical protein